MTEKELRALDEATRAFRAADRARDAAHAKAVAAIVAALQAGGMPTEVAKRSPFTAAYVRKLARDHNIPAAKPGIKAKKATA